DRLAANGRVADLLHHDGRAVCDQRSHLDAHAADRGELCGQLGLDGVRTPAYSLRTVHPLGGVMEEATEFLRLRVFPSGKKLAYQRLRRMTHVHHLPLKAGLPTTRAEP